MSDRESTIWCEKCPECQFDMFQALYAKLTDCGTTFDIECPKCGAEFSVHVDMIPEFGIKRKEKR